MRSKIELAVRQYNMLSKDDTVIVGVSGGADSMALLHYLHTNRDVFGIQIIAAHFNHCIRGEEADRDENYVVGFCKKYNIHCVTDRADIPTLAQQKKQGVEECARQMRYAFLESIDANAKIATAHTNSDSCESFLFHYTRGTGLSGLCGIPPVRGRIIRPLIFCSAEDTRNYCSEHGIDWCVDSTNADVHYSRNRIRMNTVPSLKQVNSSFEENALRCMQILQTENDYIASQAERALLMCCKDVSSLDLNVLGTYHTAIIRRVLLLFARSCGCNDVTMEQVQRLLNASDGEVLTLNNAIRFQKTDNILCLLHEATPTDEVIIPLDLSEDRVLHFFEWTIQFKVVDRVLNDTCCCTYFDADKVVMPVLRNRRAGDSLRSRKRKCTKTMKQLFSEAKIGEEQRKKWPILADDKGVIWVAEFGVDESRLPDADTKNIIKIEWGKSL